MISRYDVDFDLGRCEEFDNGFYVKYVDFAAAVEEAYSEGWHACQLHRGTGISQDTAWQLSDSKVEVGNV